MKLSTIRAVCIASACLVLFTGCITEKLAIESRLKNELRIYGDNSSYSFSPQSSRYNQSPVLTTMDLDSILEKESVRDFDAFEKYSKQTYYSSDGVSITRHYYLMPGKGKDIAKLLNAHVKGVVYDDKCTLDNLNSEIMKPPALKPGETGPRGKALVFENVIEDKRPSSDPSYKGFTSYKHKTGFVADLMIVTVNNRELLMEVDSFLERLLTELPLIDVKVKVMEIAVNDAWQWGNENIISRLTGSSKGFLKEWFNFFNTESMIKAGGDVADFQGSLFNALGVHDKFQLDATFELLQRITDSDILSAPTITVLNGHRAVIETGDKVPKQTISATATASYFGTSYEQTGVKLVIVPFLLPGDIIELHINVEVIAVTGKESFATPDGTLSQPVLSNRNFSTRIQIKEGSAFAVGGLMSTSEFEVVSKLPLLGDIPILGYLFKSKNVEKGQSQIIFSVEPRVVKRRDGWRKRDAE